MKLHALLPVPGDWSRGVSVHEEPPMEALIQLVTDSFLRHGIEVPVVDASSHWRTAENVHAPAMIPSSLEPAALREHSFRNTLETGITP